MELKDKLEYIRKCVGYIDYLRREYSPRKIVRTTSALSVFLYFFQTAIQALIDMGLSFLVERGVQSLRRYIDIGLKLQEEGVFSSEDFALFKLILDSGRMIVYEDAFDIRDSLERMLRDRLYFGIMKLALKIVDKAEEIGIDP